MQPVSVKDGDIGNCRGKRVDVIWIYTDHNRSEKKRREHRIEKRWEERKGKDIQAIEVKQAKHARRNIV